MSARSSTEAAALAPDGQAAARSLLAGLFALSLAGLGVGYLCEVSALRVAGLLGCVCFGVGAAPLQLARGPGIAARIGFACLLGFSALTLGGTLMVLVPLWHPVLAACALGGVAAMLHAAGLLQMHRDRRSERREHMAPMNDRTGQRGERREYTAATDDRTGLVELPHQLVDRPADPPRRARLALDGTLGNEPSPATAYVLATNARTGFVEVPDQVVASPADQPRRARPSLVGALRNERSGATTGVLDRTGLVEVPDQVVASPADPPRRARPSLVGALRNEPFPATTGMPDRNGFVEVPHQLVDSPPAPPRRARPSLVGALRNAPSAATTCVLAGTALWLAAAVRIGHVVPGNDGFLSKIMPLWYVGVLLLVAAIAFARKAREPVAICAVVSLMLALTLTPALAYGMPEIQTAAKHIELVQTILHQHSLNASTGIYDTYSGFFSAIAWLCDLGSIRDSVGIATFWPCIVGLVGLAELRWLFGSLIDSRFRIWAAVTLAVLANTVEENYFSPQSLGIVLAIGVFALVLDESSVAVERWMRDALLVLAGCALAVTHEISPFIVGGALILLALLRCGRPRWAAAAMLIPATTWALLHQSVIAPYFSLSSLLQASNFRPPALDTAPTLARKMITIISFDALVLGGLVLIALATIGWARHRRERWAWACVLCPAIGLVFTAVNPYNNEGIYRAILFGIPWLAVLAAHAPNARPGRWVLGAFALVTVVLLATFSAATFSLDGFTVIRPADLTALRRFEAQAPPGSFDVVLGFNELPSTVATSPTPYRFISWQKVLTGNELDRRPTPKDVNVLARGLEPYTNDGPGGRSVAVYAAWSPTSRVYAVDYGLMSYANETAWLHLMLQSRFWKVDYSSDSTYLFKLRPAYRHHRARRRHAHHRGPHQ
jgi:hypothetical protein